jgi:hypothetical protein
MSAKSTKRGYFAQIRLKYAVFTLIIVLFGGWWFFRGSDLLENFFGEAPEVEYFKKTIQELKATDPLAANALDAIARQRDMQEWALAFKAREKVDGLSGVRTLAKKIEQERPAYEKVLVDIASRPDAFNDKQERDRFLQAYDAYFEFFGERTVDEDARSLERFAGNAVYWYAIKDDPAALVMLQNGVFEGESRLLDFYVEQKDWLQFALSSAMACLADNTDTRPRVDVNFMKNVILRSMQFYPASKAFAELEGDDGFIFSAIFLEYAHILSPAVSQYHLPPEEAAGVIFANADQYLAVPVDAQFSPGELRRGEEQARELAYLKEKKNSIWNRAQEYPLILRFEKDAPDAAERLLNRYENLPVFIYSLYPDEAVQAIRAVDLYGDLALAVLQKYSHSERMHAKLREEKVNTRIVPLVLRHGDRAFELLEDDTRWLDRYVERDGTPRDDSQGWLFAIPLVGAPMMVINNWRNGYPNTWGELGWAGLDVIGCVTLVMSLPAGGGKTLAQGVAKGTSGTSVRMAVQETTKMVITPKIASTGVKGATSFLRRYIAVLFGQTARIAKGTGRVLRYAWDVTTAVVKNPGTRKWIARAAFAAYLAVVIDERTIPHLPDVGKAVGGMAGDLIRNGMRAVRNTFAEALIGTFDAQDRPKFARMVHQYSGIGIMLLLAFFSWRTLAPIWQS